MKTETKVVFCCGNCRWFDNSKRPVSDEAGELGHCLKGPPQVFLWRDSDGSGSGIEELDARFPEVAVYEICGQHTFDPKKIEEK